MYLTEIHVRNFRVYDGEHFIELKAPTSHQNLILLGGLNGAGKTSLFAAVVLGLYGREAAGLIFERSRSVDLSDAYARFLAESLSFPAKARGENEMSVRLTAFHEGAELRIQRNWWFVNGAFDDESLWIYKDGQPLQVEYEEGEDRQQLLQDFIESFAPARVGKFFFFDGEEIRTIAETDTNRAVVEGLNQLLGFFSLSRLVDDLQSLKTNIRRDLPGATDSGFAAAFEEAQSTREQIIQLRTQSDEAAALLAGVRADLQKVEEDLRALFDGQAIESRSDALTAIAEREREIASIGAEIQSFVTEVLTLAVPIDLFKRVVRRATNEAQIRRAHEAAKRLRPIKHRIEKFVLDRDAQPPTPLTAPQKAFLRRRLSEAWEAFVESNPESERFLFDDFSIEELERLKETFEQVKETARRELTSRLARRSHLQKDAARLRKAQSLFETGSVAQELLERKSHLLEQELRLRADIERFNSAIQVTEQELANQQAVVTRLEQQLVTTDEMRRELETVDRLQAATEEFMDNLRRKRSIALADMTTQMVRQLAHKEDLVDRVEIDSHDFAIRILDRQGEELRNLSAGEREIFALSMVWGLSQISKRALPVIIDTPLGRLDQMHRANVVQKFLPIAGEQVIVLATDSEIDSRWYAALKPHILQEGVIEFDQETQSSRLRTGAYLELELSHGEAL